MAKTVGQRREPARRNVRAAVDAVAILTGTMQSMAFPSSYRLAPVTDAIAVVVRRLSALQVSPEVEEMRARAEGYLHETKVWAHSPSTAQERDALMKRLLKLHVGA